jgi:hypothetical protein
MPTTASSSTAAKSRFAPTAGPRGTPPTLAARSASPATTAFRPGSPEQTHAEKWKELIAKLRAGATFHCHKGVPLDPEGEDGFAYPKDRPEKLRLCRGYLNALGKWWGAAEPDQSKAPGADQQ